MKDLILNRRDIGNPAGGGAEVYTHEIAKGLLAAGHEVDVFSSLFRGAAPEEFIDGVRYVRRGNEMTVHFLGFRHAFFHKADYSLIMDEFNGLGFGGFLLPKTKSVILIHQLYREFWFRELGPPGIVPYLIEPLLLRLYRGRPAITVSESTRADLEGLGFANVRIIMNALDTPPLEALPQKENGPTIAYLGRLRATKRPADAIKIFKLVKKAVPGARLWIMGTGPEEAGLRKLAEDTSGIEFLGYVSDREKFERLARAHLLVVPSVREGFGINVIEAAGRGTPSIGYDVHGLRDSIKDSRTGYLARGPGEAAEKIISLLNDKALYLRIASNCLEYARQFNWQRRREELLLALKQMGFITSRARR